MANCFPNGREFGNDAPSSSDPTSAAHELLGEDETLFTLTSFSLYVTLLAFLTKKGRTTWKILSLLQWCAFRTSLRDSVKQSSRGRTRPEEPSATWPRPLAGGFLSRHSMKRSRRLAEKIGGARSVSFQGVPYLPRVEAFTYLSQKLAKTDERQ